MFDRVNAPNTLWEEKYRPKKLEDYIASPELKESISKYIEKQEIPHLLFHSHSPGSGKTTLAKLLVSNISCDYMYLNASDENGIDVIREKVKTFASAAGFSDLKVIILDEMDGATPDGQRALRNIMETFSKTTRFILTCNYIERIIDPIQSRCDVFHVVPPSKKDIAVRVMSILENESIEYDKLDVKKILDTNYPDIRRIIKACQRFSDTGKLIIDEHVVVETKYVDTILDLLKNIKSAGNKQTFTDIRQCIADSGFREFTALYSHLFKHVDEFASGNIAQVILILADGSYKSSLVVDKEIAVMATLLEILNVIGE